MPKKPKINERRPRLADDKKQEMMAVLVRNRDAFDALSGTLTVKQLKQWSVPMALIWKMVLDFDQLHGELPDRGQLHADLSNYIEANQDALDDEELDVVDQFLAYAWDDEHHGPNIEKSRKHLRAALRTCSQFLEELIAVDFQQEMSSAGGIAIDMPRLFEVTQAAVNQARSLVDANIDVPFPGGWDERTETVLFSTGVPALDEFMRGGYRGGETFLFMGPFGSCKTTLTCAGASAQIQQCMQAEVEGKARVNHKGDVMIPQVVLMFSESDFNEYRCRLMSNLAMIPWDRLAGMTSIEDLDASDYPGATTATKYELAAFSKSIEDGMPWFSEQQRVRSAQALANRYLVLLDCTSTSEVVKIGVGGMQDIANVINAIYLKRKHTHYPYSFWLDHLSGVIDQVSSLISDEPTIRRMLMNMPRIATELICRKYNAPMGIMHQLSGESQDKGPAGKLHHSNAEGSRSLGKYFTFAIQSGAADENHMCKWDMTKHRRTPAMPYRIVEVRGAFNQLIDRAETHGIVPGQRVIMSRSEMHMIGMGENTASGAKFQDLADPVD